MVGSEPAGVPRDDVVARRVLRSDHRGEYPRVGACHRGGAVGAYVLRVVLPPGGATDHGDEGDEERGSSPPRRARARAHARLPVLIHDVRRREHDSVLAVASAGHCADPRARPEGVIDRADPAEESL